MSSSPSRWRLTITGVVQGVGFRPFIYGLAIKHQLTGFVGNDSGGVFIEIEGSRAALAAFRQDISANPPPLAHIETISTIELPTAGSMDFVIAHSQVQAAKQTLISPDISICDDCLADLRDPANRRYHYPFTNCTNCGPRFTIIKDIPYDRPLTTMAAFPMCPECLAEYQDPLNRRFHAQPNACPICGPHVWLEYAERPDEIVAQKDRAIAQTRELLAGGRIVAIKGLGGFHLACNAYDDRVLDLLRRRKGRVDKPFAVMALDPAAVRSFAVLSAAEEAVLVSKERPILLLQKKSGHFLSDLVAPGNKTIGVMLPYTPLHYLLLEPFQNNDLPIVLVMTSGNYSDDPIVKDNDEARDRLSHMADAFLFHNRDIHARCDDSVLRLPPPAEPAEAPLASHHSPLTFMPIRRSRGYAPFPVKLPFPVPPILAVGGELKATFCLAKDQYAYMSQHIGDMENLETLEAFAAAVDHYQHIFRTAPQIIACDLHPRYLSTLWAEEQAEPGRLVKVQHHHAHIAALMAEHGLDGTEPVLGFSFDGTGYGLDHAIWGGEVFIAGYASAERVAHLAYMPLVGGNAAIKRPYRLALSYLAAAGLPWDDRLPCVTACSVEERQVLRRQLDTNLNVVPTSSIGRLFDVVASIAGVCQEVTYEAQAAVELESAISPDERGTYPVQIVSNQINIKMMLQAVTADVLSGTPVSVISTRFHNTIANLILNISLEWRERRGLNKVALSGGVFQNTTLLTSSVWLLGEAGFETLVHHLVPANDGGLALGQAMIAAAKSES